MLLEKNPKTRPIAVNLLKLEDRLKGKPFASMVRAREISNYSCGPATLNMLLSFVGYKASQRSLIKAVRAQSKIKKYGIDVNDMAKAVKVTCKGNVVLWRKQKATINDIYLGITRYGYPVGVEWLGDFFEHEDEDKGHYAVVTKVDKKHDFLRIADPYFNTFFKYKDLDRKYSISEFVKIWWDINEIKVSGTKKRRSIKDTRMMFVVTPKDETWPKKLGMRK